MEHHPEVLKLGDGRWIVRCPQCLRAGKTETPIGIGTPLESEYEAQLIRDNHLSRRGKRTSR